MGLLIVLLLIFVGGHFYFKWKNRALNFSSLKRFHYVPYTNSYEVAAPQLSFIGQKAERALLLLHGFSSSPSEFAPLMERLQKEKIPYYAPLLSGFGMGDFHFLEEVKATDWVRDAVFGFDLLASLAEKVDVLGHSNGGCLAVLLAQHRPIDRLLLSAPNLFALPSDVKVKKCVQTPLLGPLIRFFFAAYKMPVRADRISYIDVRDSSAIANSFQFEALPTNSFSVLFTVQDMAQKNLHHLREKPLFLLYGEKDSSVNMPEAIETLNREGISFKQFSYKNSGHNIFADFDRKELIEDVIAILNI